MSGVSSDTHSPTNHTQEFLAVSAQTRGYIENNWSRFPKGVESSLVDGGSGGERSLPLTMGVLGAAWRLPQW